MKKLTLLLFILPLFVVAQELPTIYTESLEEGKYFERGKIFEEAYQDFLQDINDDRTLNETEEDWGEECNKILDYYNKYGTITERMWIDLDCVCSPFCYGGNYASAKNASSTLASHGKYNYRVSNITDGDPRTTWIEGKSDYGIGESFEIYISYFGWETQLSVLNGLQYSINLWKYNSRVKIFKLYFNNVPICYLRLEDNMARQYFDIANLLSGEASDPYDVDWLELRDNTLRFEIVDIYPGKKWKDVCISGIKASQRGG